MSKGVIRAIKDLIVTVVFDEDMPAIHEILLVKVGEQNEVPLLVDSLQPGNRAQCLNIQSDRSIQKGMEVTRSNHSIEIPVGNELIGRVLDTLGMPIDGLPPKPEGQPKRSIFTALW
jgi:F-type H+-transporting ATPase subunit beta